jgi:hypothetical protein
MNNSELANKCRGLAQGRSSNGADAEVKNTLLEVAHRLDSSFKVVYFEYGKLWIKNALGKHRVMRLKERILYRVFGALPERV